MRIKFKNLYTNLSTIFIVFKPGLESNFYKSKTPLKSKGNKLEEGEINNLTRFIYKDEFSTTQPREESEGKF